MKETIDLRKKEEPSGTHKPEPAESPKQEHMQKMQNAVSEIEWQADYSYHSSPLWREGIIILMMGVIIASILLKLGIISTVFFSMLFIFLLVRVHFSPKNLLVRMNQYGIEISGRKIPYSELRSFFIQYDPDSIQELCLEYRKWFMPYTRIPIAGQNPVHMRDFLLNYIPEIEHTDTFIDTIVRKIGL